MSLFDTAVGLGWHVDGEDGFVYTTDFEGAPVVRNRLHWVLAEGIGAAWALGRELDDAAYRDWYAAWWGQAEARFIDREDGSWRHELDQSNQPASTVWAGKPDVYHAYQAALLPSLGPAASFAGGLLRQDACLAPDDPAAMSLALADGQYRYGSQEPCRPVRPAAARLDPRRDPAGTGADPGARHRWTEPAHLLAEHREP